MPAFRLIIGIFFAAILLLTGPLPAHAASSAAIRAIDDVQPTSRDYSGQSLVQAEFADARLEEANFSGADLRGAVFNGSNLKNANLHGIDFSNGIAYITNFSGADLTDAVLTSALMLKSSFRDAKVDGADFTDAVLDRQQIVALCKTATGTNPITGVDTRESLGCS
ncbi:pentapeptide repeat-containing protein [Leptolyngbya sp. AN02str]|uniref:pentapeptide repeat-containing protein n=1 Tax=Leptolyngbya sp. AN02str TaxID=3423363 RepID=UPI003D3240C6